MGSMSFSLAATPRTVFGRKVKELLANRQIPGVIYGYKTENQPIQVEEGSFRKVLQGAGENQVVDLTIGKTTHHVLIRDVQIDPIRRDLIHSDFYAIDITKPVDVEVPLEFTGEAPAVKLTGGSLVKKMSIIKVRCLPKDFVKFITVPVDGLETLEDVIRISDLKVPATWTMLENPADVVGKVVPPRIETFDVKPADVEAAVVAAVNAVPAAEGEKAADGKDAKGKDAGKGDAKKEGKKEAKK